MQTDVRQLRSRTPNTVGCAPPQRRVHTKLLSLVFPALEAAFDRMNQDTGMMFRTFTKTIKLTTTGDIQEIPDANLILLCRFLTRLDDSEYKQLKGALD